MKCLWVNAARDVRPHRSLWEFDLDPRRPSEFVDTRGMSWKKSVENVGNVHSNLHKVTISIMFGCVRASRSQGPGVRGCMFTANLPLGSRYLDILLLKTIQLIPEMLGYSARNFEMLHDTGLRDERSTAAHGKCV